MQNLHIKAHLLTPIAVTDDYSPSLESLLIWLWLDRRGLASPNATNEISTTTEIPLEKSYYGDLWIYKCSSPFYYFQGENKSRFRRRWEPNDGRISWGKRKAKFDTSQGKEKACDLPLYYKTVAVINWCCVGDLQSIESIINRCRNLGKKRSYGFGQVSHWEVVEIDEDWHVNRDGKLMRPIPLEIFAEHYSGLETDGRVLKWGYNHPYWLQENQDYCAMPNINQKIVPPIKVKINVS